jgi:hypothetical protein
MAEAKHRLHQGRDLYETVTKVAELRPGSALWINQSNQCAKGRCEMILGYARVSTEDQCFDGQLDALRAAGCQKIYREKISGTVRDRRALTAAIDTLGPGGSADRDAARSACQIDQGPIELARSHSPRNSSRTSVMTIFINEASTVAMTQIIAPTKPNAPRLIARMAVSGLGMMIATT